jgi:hypothetical protein
MNHVEIILCVTVVITQLAALLQSPSVPYFPIEISRTAAANPISYRAFVIGCVSLGVPLLVSKDYATRYLLVWFSLLIIAGFDDQDYWLTHMIGVTFLFITVAARLYVQGWRSQVLFVCGVFVYLMRIVLKFIVVLGLEYDNPRLELFTPSNLRSTIGSLTTIGLDIAYRGASACKHPQYVLPVFRACGVLQWVSFYLLAKCL